MATNHLLIITGAGASHDCVGPLVARLEVGPGEGIAVLGRHRFDYVRPPLTKDLVAGTDLFSGLLARHPDALPVASEIQGRLRSQVDAPTLEAALREYHDNSIDDRVRQRHLVAFRFYLRDVLWAVTHYMNSPQVGGGVTHYMRLVGRARSWARREDARVTFVNFNYDVLLELALKHSAGFDPLRGALTDEERVWLLKPHGSVHWAWPLPGIPGDSKYSRSRSYREALDRGGDVGPATDVEVVGSPFVAQEDRVRPSVPALAIPMQGGSKLMLSEAGRSHMASLSEAVTHILVIGWRGVEPEFAELLGPVAREGARFLAVAGGIAAADETQDVFQLFANEREVEQLTPVLEGFTRFDQEGHIGRLLDT